MSASKGMVSQRAARSIEAGRLERQGRVYKLGPEPVEVRSFPMDNDDVLFEP